MEKLSFQDQNLLLPITAAKQKAVTSPSNSNNTTQRSTSGMGSPSSFRRKGSDASCKKSSFSKRSSKSTENNEIIDHNFGDMVHQVNNQCYQRRMNTDFDQRKNYEEMALKILNEYSRCNKTHPENYEDFSILYKKSESDTRKQTIFLDIDDTIVNVSLFQLPNSECQEIEIEESSGKIIKMFVYLRPGLQDFLQTLSKYFEVILFNNSSEQYTKTVANKILSSLPIQDQPYYSYVLNKNHCTINSVGHEIKNLDFFTGQGSNRRIEDCIIVDNNLYCFQNNMTNGLLIPKFQNQSDDDWLPLLQNYIIDKLLNVDDVRSVISQDFSFEDILSSSRVSQIRKMMEKHLIIEEERDSQIGSNKDLGDEEYFSNGVNSHKNSSMQLDEDISIKHKYLNYLD